MYVCMYVCMYVRSLTWRDASDCSVTHVLSSADLALGPADVAEGSCPVERPRLSQKDVRKGEVTAD